MNWTPEQITALVSSLSSAVITLVGVVFAYFLNRMKEKRKDKIELTAEQKKEIIEELKDNTEHE